MKYVDEQRNVKTMVAEKKHFKGVENYFTNALLYANALQAVERSSLSEFDSDNKANSESEPEGNEE